LPFVGPTFNNIGRVLSKHIVKSLCLPPKKVTVFLLPIKDDLGLKTHNYTASSACLGRSTLEEPGVPVRQGSKNTISMSGSFIQRNQLEACTAQTWVTTPSFTTPVYWSRNMDIWNMSLRKKVST
jgi:hypothetical protein